MYTRHSLALIVLAMSVSAIAQHDPVVARRHKQLGRQGLLDQIIPGPSSAPIASASSTPEETSSSPPVVPSEVSTPQPPPTSSVVVSQPSVTPSPSVSPAPSTPSPPPVVSESTVSEEPTPSVTPSSVRETPSSSSAVSSSSRASSSASSAPAATTSAPPRAPITLAPAGKQTVVVGTLTQEVDGPQSSGLPETTVKAGDKTGAAANNSFWKNTPAVTGTFVGVGIAVLAIVAGLVYFFRKRGNVRLDSDDTYFEKYEPSTVPDRSPSAAGHNNRGNSTAAEMYERDQRDVHGGNGMDQLGGIDDMTVPAAMGAYPSRDLHYGTDQNYGQAYGQSQQYGDTYAPQDYGIEYPPGAAAPPQDYTVDYPPASNYNSQQANGQQYFPQENTHQYAAYGAVEPQHHQGSHPYADPMHASRSAVGREGAYESQADSFYGGAVAR